MSPPHHPCAHKVLKDKVDSIKAGDAEAAVIELLGEPTSRTTEGEITTLAWKCPGHEASHICVDLKEGAVTEARWSA
ncbi:hypothetical protein DL89DRAFT_264978 [Linderina pennispora]|uniref:Uncharacterized protein n=1 Tax=Linderina pennispora TaxID=61395 RepID=A0A1Y1WH38_9FUNG|nr:uncharacterized protein DL89DRAFT_264978 [Linderina pennispora]ORX72782.1 hypothetical protein DL89DRAFT_264978 [Linderina pennispora]